MINYEDILEDLFHHCFINKIKLLLKVSNLLDKFKYLLSYFNYNVKFKVNDLVLFDPKISPSLQLVKKKFICNDYWL